MSVRVRFAPSPTGFLHIGGVRTALYNFLFARHHGGQFLLRIEDTDLERSEQQYTDDILASLNWLGMRPDEEIVYQSRRLEVYQAEAEKLISMGKAYRCTCTEADIQAMRERAMQEQKKPMYDRRCRDKNLPATVVPYVIRAKIPLQGSVRFNDLIRGPIEFLNEELDDFVLIRSNRAPTYNFSVVIDDVFMKMTHIIRGDDHINNTPKQVHLYHFLNYPQPEFAHLSMILGPDKKKLSKRHGAVSANVYRGEGYLPEALNNFLARLGWSHGDQEVFTTEEMIRFFTFENVQKSSAVFNAEKLLWLNGEKIRSATPGHLSQIIISDYSDLFRSPAKIEKLSLPLGHRLIALIQPKVKLLKDLADQLVPLTMDGAVEVDASELKWIKDPSQKAVGQSCAQAFYQELKSKIGSSQTLEEAGFPSSELDRILKEHCSRSGIKMGDVAPALRLCVTGRMVSAGVLDLMAILPFQTVQARIERALSL